MRLKKHYSSREVAVLTGLSARQLQWWDARRLFVPAIRSHRTEAGGFTERRYTPMDVLELQVLADLRRRRFSIPQLRRLLSTLRDVFGIRLYEAIGEGGPMSLFVSGDQLYARTRGRTDVQHGASDGADADGWRGAAAAAARRARAQAPPRGVAAKTVKD